MSRYIFNKDSDWWSKEEKESLESFFSRQNGHWKESIEQFFSIPEIQEWVNANDWNAVFREWDDGYSGYEKPGLDIGESKKYRKWVVDVLALFLALTGVEFMRYLDDKYVRKNFRPDNLIDTEDDSL